jgi:hypothetical protein
MSKEIEVRPEDRIALRRALRAEARLSASEGDLVLSGVVTDLSVHGLWVAVDAPAPLGAHLFVTFAPADGFAEVTLLGSVARIDRHAGSEAALGMGISFVDLSREDQRVLEDALSGLPMRPMRPTAPVIALVEYDPLEDEVEHILDEDDLVGIAESGLFAIVVEGGRDDEFTPLSDAELELFAAAPKS